MKKSDNVNNQVVPARLISHRGNLNGRNPLAENNPKYLIDASRLFLVEVDLWYEGGFFYTGHDEPTFSIDQYFLQNESFLLHAKDVKTFLAVSQLPKVEVFYQDENLVATSNKGRVIFHSSIRFEIEDRANYVLIDLNAEMPEYGHLHSVMTDFPEKLSLNSTFVELPFDLLILDIDGVMTNGTKMYGVDGEVLGKRFNDKDFTAIKRFLAQGIDVVFLSGDRSVNEKMAEIRGIEFVYSKSKDGVLDKSRFVDELRMKYGARKVAYVGDDYYDLGAMLKADITFCPADAVIDVKKYVSHVTNCRGGEGVVAELFELSFRERRTVYAHDFIKSRFH